METYDFDTLVDRRGTNSYKWDSAADSDILPMWVADMDFRAAPPILRALRQRVDHAVFGYTRVPQAYFDAVTGWFARRHGWHFPAEWMLYTSGVVPALSAIIKALAEPGDGVLLLTPVYNCFFSSVRNNGCKVVASPLVWQDATYHIDFDDFERRAADPATRLFLLCNPHNPAGRVWSREELTRLGDICLRHGVTVVADEIHCELVMPGHVYIPYGSLGDKYLHHSVTCNSASKAFNIAGLQIANIVCPDDAWRRRIDRALNVNEVCDVNPFGVVATQAAYSDEGAAWLDALLAYLYDNDQFMLRYQQEHLPDFPLARLEGTYLAWMDCRALGLSSAELEERLKSKARLWLNAGTMYGEDGEGFMRWNLACPRTRVAEGLERFRRFVDAVQP